jgi:hypothetical protein
MREFSQVRTVASRNSLYQILAIDVALGLGQRAKTWLSHTPIPLGAGLSEGDCYRELRRISLPRTLANSALEELEDGLLDRAVPFDS